jgi:two-component system, OmpR family, phosphate regulon sensor histidine kinase PhoR
MDRTYRFIHPIFIFVISIIALGTSLILYIYWYMEVSSGIKTVVDKFNLDPDQILTGQTWVVILVLSILVGTILLGMFTIFVYSQKMVQLYRLQRNFISNFTHELKTPVASLSLYLETFQKYELPRDEQLKYIEYMLADVQRLTGNITRILNLARIENKKYRAEFSGLEPATVISQFLEKNGHLFSNCRVRFSNDIDKTVRLRINPSLFEILIMNLMTNAIKYNTSPAPSIDIRVKQIPGSVQIQIQDNGIGFAASEKKKIFKKFYQIGSSDDMSAKGSGLGLYLAQSIAKIHRGSISATSAGPGKGATFKLTLPLPKKKAS